MAIIDIGIVIVLIYAAWRGFKKGFILEVFTFLALFLGLYAGIHFSDFAAKILQEDVGITGKYVPAISFTVVFLLVGAMVFFGGKALEQVIKVVQLSLINKFLGVFFSTLKMIMILGAAILTIDAYDEQGDFLSSEMKSESLFYNPLKSVVTFVIPAFDESTLFLKNALSKNPTT